MSYPDGVVVSNVPCGGPHSMKVRKCPEGNMLKQKIVNSKGDRCFKCWQHDHPDMNSHPYKDSPTGKPSGVRCLPGSKGGPKKKSRTMSAGK